MNRWPDSATQDTGLITAISDKDFTTLSEIVQDASGICLSPSKKGLIVSRLARRLRELELPDIASYCRHLQCTGGSDERERLISSLTTNVTRFFREQHHFDTMRAQVLPQLIETARRGQRVRLWSAGCSTGEEPYSLAMTLCEMTPDIDRLDIRILATDIDPVVIATAREGAYPADALDTVPQDRIRRFFVKDTSAESWRIGSEPRALIAFGTLNLVGEWPMQGPFDVIFCRNVVIYFDTPTQERLWQRFAAILRPGGQLFIGHSERIGRAADRLFDNAGVTQYRRTDAPAVSAAPPLPTRPAPRAKETGT